MTPLSQIDAHMLSEAGWSRRWYASALVNGARVEGPPRYTADSARHALHEMIVQLWWPRRGFVQRRPG